jgi:hypothetical protein
MIFNMEKNNEKEIIEEGKFCVRLDKQKRLLPIILYILNLLTFPGSLPAEGREQIADIDLAVSMLAQRKVGINAIFHSPTLPFLPDITGSVKVSNNLADGPFRDTHSRSKVKSRDTRVLGNQAEGYGMFGDKGPLRHGFFSPDNIMNTLTPIYNDGIIHDILIHVSITHV